MESEQSYNKVKFMIQLHHMSSSDKTLIAALDENWRSVLKRPEIGFPTLPERSEDWLAIALRAKNVRPSKHIVVMGIGGSSLGTQVVAQAFRSERTTMLHFLESPDPASWFLRQDFSVPEWHDTHFVVVSKSGNTLETLSWLEALAARDPAWLKKAQCTVIASPGEGPLQKWAKRQDIPCLWIPTNVGGRFSVLTAVSLLPAVLLGLDLEKFREGAAWALKNSDIASQVSAQVLSSWQEGRWITQMWTYSESLKIFGEWWQQLWGESLAKKTTRSGAPAPRASTPMACLGPRDQHSLVQQLIEGARDKFIFLTRVKAIESAAPHFHPSLFPEMPFAGREISLGQILGAEAEAFARSLKESEIPFCTIEISELNEKSLGALFMLWQMVIAQLGEYMGIDAFNQPGVELGKKYAAQILRS